MKHRYTKEQVQEIAYRVNSIAKLLEELGISPSGGNYKTIQSFIRKHDIDTSSIKGNSWSKGKELGHKRDIDEYLNNRYPIQSFKLKNRLIKEGIFKKECSNCGLSTWLNNEIPLELDHINGIHDDNSLGNLRLLCPNCHALTDTYRGKNSCLKNTGTVKG